MLLSGWGDGKAINIPDADGNTALMLAASKGRSDIMDVLLRKGATFTNKV